MSEFGRRFQQRLVDAMDAKLAKSVAAAEQRLAASAAARDAVAARAAAAQAESTTRRLAAKVDAALNRALDRLSSAGGSSEDVAALRQRLETLEGATSGVAQVAPFLNMIPHPGARVIALGAAVALGAAEGRTREERRQRAMRAAQIEDERGLEQDLRFREIDDTIDRLNAARRRGRRFGR